MLHGSGDPRAPSCQDRFAWSWNPTQEHIIVLRKYFRWETIIGLLLWSLEMLKQS